MVRNLITESKVITKNSCVLCVSEIVKLAKISAIKMIQLMVFIFISLFIVIKDKVQEK